MIIRKQDREIDVRENMRGGKGKVTIVKHIPAEAMQGKARLCATLVLDPGSSIGLHEHADEYEIFIVQKGSGVIDDIGSVADVGPGYAVFTGGGEGHSVENTGDEPMEITAVILT
jgi:mannose-6-phosphate isomerase-like protein (cupin superfamily)